MRSLSQLSMAKGGAVSAADSQLLRAKLKHQDNSYHDSERPLMAPIAYNHTTC